MRTFLIIRLSLLSILSAFLFTSQGCKKDAGNTIKIGEVGSMTGTEATFGISTHRGIEMAVKEINEGGGVKGKKLELISADNQGKPDEAATIVTKLITQDKVVAILGEVASSRSIAMAPIAQNYKTPMISPSSTNPKVTELGDYIFRVCFIDPFQGFVMAKFATEHLKIKRIAILRDVKSDYSLGLTQFFTESLKKAGGEIVADQSYASGDTDFKAQLTSIKGSNPEAIYIPGYYVEVGLIARQAREVGLTVPLLGGDGWESSKLYEIGGQALEGSYFSTHYSPEDSSPAVQQFISKYKAAYGETPDALAPLAYDATKILAAALTRAENTSSAALRDAIAHTKDFPGVTGNITIDDKRNSVKAAVVLKISGNKPHFEATIAP